MDQTDKYKIEEKQIGRAGWVFYTEETRLAFPWEILGTTGISISVPTPEKWDEYCDENNAHWAKGRREEILQRVGRFMSRKESGNSSFEIEPNWIVVVPGPSLISRLLGFLE